jgi:hypothetical protein
VKTTSWYSPVQHQRMAKARFARHEPCRHSMCTKGKGHRHAGLTCRWRRRPLGGGGDYRYPSRREIGGGMAAGLLVLPSHEGCVLTPTPGSLHKMILGAACQ